jgi:hypothetical protein
MIKEKYSIFVIGFIFFYFLAGVVLGFAGAKQIFPFFSWNLFGDIPNERYEYSAILITYNGIPVSPPKLFQQGEDIISEHDSSTARRNLQNFGSAYERGDMEGANKFRKLFEENYLKAPAKYRLVKLIYDPIERWREDKYIIINIQEFEVN